MGSVDIGDVVAAVTGTGPDEDGAEDIWRAVLGRLTLFG
jgi:hypothetical protein